MGGPACPWNFADPATALDWLEAAGLAYEAWLPESTHADFRQAVKDRLEELRRADGTFDQTWVRLDLLARRP